MKRFSVLYTQQKTQKHKTWRDGILWWDLSNNQVMLYDERESEVLEVHLLPQGQTVQADGDADALHTDHYFTHVEKAL